MTTKDETGLHRLDREAKQWPVVLVFSIDYFGGGCTSPFLHSRALTWATQWLILSHASWPFIILSTNGAL